MPTQDSNTLSVTLYSRPNGAKKQIDMANINPEELEFFESGGYEVSIEEVGTANQTVLYSTTNGPASEVLVVVNNGEPCQDAMKRLRETVLEDNARDLPHQEWCEPDDVAVDSDCPFCGSVAGQQCSDITTNTEICSAVHVERLGEV
jgi:hypothetical protein